MPVSPTPAAALRRKRAGRVLAALRRESLACAVAALRARQARVLPCFAAAEDATRLAEVMSFALAACVVAERFAAVAGRARLARPGARRAPRPCRLLRRRPMRASRDRRGGRAPDRPAARPRATPARPQCAAGGRGRGGTPGGPATTGCDSRARARTRVKRAPPPAIEGGGAGWEWINWVRIGLRDGSVAVNAAGVWLHSIEGAAYAVSPACFEAFATGRDLAPATVRNRVVRLGRHRQHASPSGAANVFRAALADGSRVKGMVFPGEIMWDDDPPPRANASLVGKGPVTGPPTSNGACRRTAARAPGAGRPPGRAGTGPHPRRRGLQEGRARARVGSASTAQRAACEPA